MSDRIIPLADAPAPSEHAGADARACAAEGAFTPDPLNTLKFQPLLVEAVSKVFDPEIPVNIYELGLVYDLDVDSQHERAGPDDADRACVSGGADHSRSTSNAACAKCPASTT